MTRKRNNSPSAIDHELDAAETIVKAAEDNLARLQDAGSRLKLRESDLRARLKKIRQSGSSAREHSAERALSVARTALKRNRALIVRQKAAVVEKRRLLRSLRRQAGAFSREVVQLRSPDSPAAAVAGGVRLPTAHLYGAQIIAARAVLKLSQADFAAALGVSVAAIRRAEATQGRLPTDVFDIDDVGESLWEMGIELIDAGLYVGTGGCGIRLRQRRQRVTRLVNAPRKRAARKAARRKKKRVA